MKALIAVGFGALVLAAPAHGACDVRGGTETTPVYRSCEAGKRLAEGERWRVRVETHGQPVQIWRGGAVQERVAYLSGADQTLRRRRGATVVRARVSDGVAVIRLRQLRGSDRYAVETHEML